MSSLRSAPIFSLSLAALLAACGSTSTSSDAGSDAGGDAGPHNGGDAGTDAGLPGDGGAPPGAPILSFTTSASGVQLTWTLPGAFGGELFAVYRSDQGGPFTAVAGATGVSADDYSDGIASAQPGAGHAYYVTARNGNGTGPASNTVDVQQAPGDLVAGGSDTRVLLVWSAVGNATSYDVYRTTGDAGTATLVGNSTQAEYIDNGSTAAITTGTTYQYQLIAHAIDGGQPSTGSNIVTAKALGIDVSINVTHVSDVVDGGVTVANTVSPLYAGPLAITDAGTAHEILAFSTSTAAVMPGVPNGTYEIGLPIPGTEPGNYIYLASTTARSIDFSAAPSPAASTPPTRAIRPTRPPSPMRSPASTPGPRSTAASSIPCRA